MEFLRDLSSQLWDKRIDILADTVKNVVSAALIALVARLAWRWWARPLEEMKERDRIRIAEENAAEEEQRRINARFASAVQTWISDADQSNRIDYADNIARAIEALAVPQAELAIIGEK